MNPHLGLRMCACMPMRALALLMSLYSKPTMSALSICPPHTPLMLVSHMVVHVCLCVWESVVPPVLLLKLSGSEIDGQHQPPLACHNTVYRISLMCCYLQYSVALSLKSRTFIFLLITFLRGICCSKEATDADLWLNSCWFKSADWLRGAVWL